MKYSFTSFRGKFRAHESLVIKKIHESLNKKLPLNRKFMARNKGMKFNFAVFVGHEMLFMGYSTEIHGIFINMWFIVVAFNKP